MSLSLVKSQIFFYENPENQIWLLNPQFLDDWQLS